MQQLLAQIRWVLIQPHYPQRLHQLMGQIMPIIPKSFLDNNNANKAPTPAEGKVERIVTGWI